MTETYPDILELLNTHMPQSIESCIIDSEIVAYEPATERILPF
jgi:ATP-dependent DNA ligase